MIPSWLIIAVSLLYVAILFAIAFYFERHKASKRTNTWVYSLSMAVFCTSWAFFGTIQQAATTGWIFAPTYVGTILLMVFGWRFLHKLISVSQFNHITSIADLISSRYGKSQFLAGTITFIAIIALIPYIALQLKALNTSYLLMTSERLDTVTSANSIWNDSALYITLLMALFAIVFGTRRVDATEHQTGIIFAIAFESLIKLFAFLALGFYICWGLFDGINDVFQQAEQLTSINDQWEKSYSPLLFWTHALLGLLAIFCLPRQFHVLVVENKDVNDIKPARWIFSGYLLLINLFILPIAVAGLMYFNGATVSPEMFILAFPLSSESTLMTLVAYIGGFSAATSMIIIVSIVLSTMVSNDIVIPLSVKLKLLAKNRISDLQNWLLTTRRVIIFILLILAFVYYRTIANTSELASIGLLSFSLVAQFAPSIIGGLYWKQANRRGVFAGLAFGLATWSYLLLTPALINAGYLPSDYLYVGLLSIEALSLSQLLGQSAFDTITIGTFWSLLVNIVAYIFFSMHSKPSALEKLQAVRFVSPRELTQDEAILSDNKVTVGDVYDLCERFIGPVRTKQFFDEQLPAGQSLKSNQLASAQFIDTAQKRLSRVIGGSSAKIVMDTITGKRAMAISDVVDIVDEASQVFTFNRELLQSAMENISHGISVIDKDLKLVAWNKQYQHIFNYPDDMLIVGKPIADLIRYNAEQGLFGEGDIDEHVEKRLNHLKQAQPHTFERTHSDQLILKVQGSPMPGGGFVTAFIDITELRNKQKELARLNEALESRVKERTKALTETNLALDVAKQKADEANISKTRFLAAASHDILQPINAASLFVDVLLESVNNQQQLHQLELIRRSLNSADSLLSDLLEISKLDAGVVQPTLTTFPLQTLLSELAEEFAVIANKAQVELHVKPSSLMVSSDPTLLRRILQNLISNAIRYAPKGNVLIASRKQWSNTNEPLARIEVRDNGVGISDDRQHSIFQEFTRLEQHSTTDGHGLGLAIVERCAKLLNHPIRLRSAKGKGSTFSIGVPIAAPVLHSQVNAQSEAHQDATPQRHPEPTARRLNILCVDNDQTILTAMRELLSQWQMDVSVASSVAEAVSLLNHQPFDLLLLDHHLSSTETSFSLIEQVTLSPETRIVIITAERSDALKQRADDANIPVLYKPLKSLKLRTLINRLFREP